MFRYIIKTMCLEKPELLTVWNGGSTKQMGKKKQVI